MRVIQDSDDEFDEDLQDEMQVPQAGDASGIPHDHGTDATLTSGTGSTESLKRGFAEAHRDHLQSPSTHYALPSQEEPRSSVSLPEHVSKKMKTLNDDSTRMSPPVGSSKKGPVTYGKERKPTDSSPFLHLVNNQTEDDSTVPIYDTALGLEGTMREGYIQHDPMALFPEPSSTIPNATLTQQRVLEGVVAPAFLGVHSEADSPPHQHIPEASVPWSDLLKFSPTGTEEQSEPSDQRPQAEPDSAPLQRFPEQTQESFKSERSHRGSSVRLRGSPFMNEMMLESIDPKDIMPPPQLTLLSQDLELPSTASGVSQPDTKGKSQKSSQRQKHKVASIPNSDEDLAAIGLPIEQYKPRPSRSRSLRVSSDEPINFSIRPEKAAKGTRRRKTTTAAAVTTPMAEFIATPEKLRQICDMGFTPTSTGRALKQNNGDVTVTVEWLITNGMGEDELSSSNTPKRKSTPKKLKSDQSMVAKQPPEVQVPTISEIVDFTELSMDIETPNKSTPMKDTNPTSANQQRSPKVQVVIPMKSPKPKSSPKPDPPNASSKKAKRRKTTLDLPESEAALEIPTLPAVATEKKRGRGRPKKTADAVKTTELVQDMPTETVLEQRDEADKILQTIEPNATTPVTSISSDMHASGDFKDRTPGSAMTPKDPHPSLPSRTPEQATKPSSRSPVSKGKATYRVGLSKRARIAPLLRTLKK